MTSIIIWMLYLTLMRLAWKDEYSVLCERYLRIVLRIKQLDAIGRLISVGAVAVFFFTLCAEHAVTEIGGVRRRLRGDRGVTTEEWSNMQHALEVQLAEDL